MTEMRQLGSLYMDFRKIWRQQKENSDVPEIKAMFKRGNFGVLEAAIISNSSDKDTIKPGLKLAHSYVLKTAAKILKASYLMDDKDAEATEIDKFVDILNLNHNYIFGDAEYLLQKGRKVKLRKPQRLPQEGDVQRVRTYTIESVKRLLNDEYLQWSAHEFIKLRDLIVCRLTLFNARRGGEPSRLHLNEWQEVESDSWIEKRHIDGLQDPIEKALVKNTKIAYQSGKGTKRLVSVLLPKDTVDGIRKLVDPELRKDVGVHKDNVYVFPSTQSSSDHVSGWHATNSVCQDAGIEDPSLLTATKMRHRASTLYASLDVPAQERDFFYKHMGHSGDFNKEVYQTPLAVMAITKVGKHLYNFDNRK